MKRARSVSLLSLSAVLLGAAMAWACTGQPRILALTPMGGPVGLEITVRGQAAPPNYPVEVRWNDLKGPQIASAVTDPAGNFSVSATIPESQPGIYFVVVSAGDAGVGRSAFTVTSETPHGPAAVASERTLNKGPSSSDLWTGFSSNASGAEDAALTDSLANEKQSYPAALTAGVALFVLGSAAFVSVLAGANRRRSARAVGGKTSS